MSVYCVCVYVFYVLSMDVYYIFRRRSESSLSPCYLHFFKFMPYLHRNRKFSQRHR